MNMTGLQTTNGLLSIYTVKYLLNINHQWTVKGPILINARQQMKPKELQSPCLDEWGHQSFLSGRLLHCFIQDIYNHNELRQNIKLQPVCLRVI